MQTPIRIARQILGAFGHVEYLGIHQVVEVAKPSHQRLPNSPKLYLYVTRKCTQFFPVHSKSNFYTLAVDLTFERRVAIYWSLDLSQRSPSDSSKLLTLFIHSIIRVQLK